MSASDANSTGADTESTKLRRCSCRKCGLALLAMLVVIQIVPYGRNHTNPAITADVAWDSGETETLVRGACFDCHSNETVWPWYCHVAPVSWLVQHDVDEGRRKLNFSEGNLDELEEVAEVISEGEMPPWFYKPAHSEAQLSAAQEAALLTGMEATFGNVGESGGERGEAHDEDDD